MPKPRVGVVGTDMECGPMGELMTEKGGPMPLMGELRVLMGECSCPGEPSEGPMLGPREGCSEGAAMELRAAGEPREEELTCVEKSYRRGNQEQDWRGLSRPASWAAQYLPSRHSCWRGVDEDPHQRLQMRKAEPPTAQGSPLQDAAFKKPWAFEEAWAWRLGPGASLRGHSARVGGTSTPECPPLKS